MLLSCMIEQCRADPLTEVRRIDEQHLDLCFLQADEAGDAAGGIFANPYVHSRQIEISDLRVECLDILLAEEGVSFSHGAKPDFNQ